MNGNGHSHYTLDDWLDVREADEEDLQTLRSIAAQEGIDLSLPSHQRAIRRRRQEVIMLEQDNRPNKPSKWFETFRNTVVSLIGAVAMLQMLFSGYILLPVILLGLWIVEISRVHVGIQLWDEGWRTTLAAVVIVSMYVSLLVIRAGMLRANQNKAYRWSLGLVLCDIKYRLSIGRNWKPEEKEATARINFVISMVGGLIVILGTTGVMQNEISFIDAVWYRGLEQIITDSKLLTFLTLLGGGATTAVLLVALHFVTTATYNEYLKVMPESEAQDFFGSSYTGYSVEADRQEALYLQALVNRERLKRAQRQ